MDLQVVIRNTPEAPAIRAFAEQKLVSALERFEREVLAAVVRLEDETGPTKGGVDKQCHVEVKLRGRDLRVKEQGEDFYATIDTAMDRLRTLVGKEVSRAKRGVAEG
jgi:ribosomal subunit interface protein